MTSKRLKYRFVFVYATYCCRNNNSSFLCKLVQPSLFLTLTVKLFHRVAAASQSRRSKRISLAGFRGLRPAATVDTERDSTRQHPVRPSARPHTVRGGHVRLRPAAGPADTAGWRQHRDRREGRRACCLPGCVKRIIV